MMWARAAFGIVLCLVGGVFFGQGIGAIHGSVMTGELQWAVIGGVLFAVGVALLVWAWRLARERADV
jgi:ABC-type glucose/galactose transport system permease subunit